MRSGGGRLFVTPFFFTSHRQNFGQEDVEFPPLSSLALLVPQWLLCFPITVDLGCMKERIRVGSYAHPRTLPFVPGINDARRASASRTHPRAKFDDDIVCICANTQTWHCWDTYGKTQRLSCGEPKEQASRKIKQAKSAARVLQQHGRYTSMCINTPLKKTGSRGAKKNVQVE